MKPYVVCHMCTTIDGRILTKRWGKMPGGKGAGGLYETTADSFGVDAWIVGTTTMKEFAGKDQKLKKPHCKVEKGDFLANKSAKRFAIGVDAKPCIEVRCGLQATGQTRRRALRSRSLLSRCAMQRETDDQRAAAGKQLTAIEIDKTVHGALPDVVDSSAASIRRAARWIARRIRM